MWLLVGWFLPLFWDELPLWSTFLLLWMVSGCCLWSLMTILALVTFVPRSYAPWFALLFEWPMLVLWGCLSSIDKTLGSPLQGEFASLIEFDACCVSPWVQGGVWSFALRNLMFWLLPSWVQNLMFATYMAWFEGELVIRLSFKGSMVFCIEKPRILVTTLLSSKLDVCHLYGLVWGRVGALACILVYFAFLLYFCHTHLSHFASHVILMCICLIMLIIVLGWVVMRCETLLLGHAR
jgi:hypothetical protein